MKKVLKYLVPRRSPKYSMMLPINSVFLRVHFQGEDLQMWREVDTDSNIQTQFNFQVFGTAHEIPKSAKWLATYDDGPFVFHLYQL